jgi:hypothetical protein
MFLYLLRSQPMMVGMMLLILLKIKLMDGQQFHYHYLLLLLLSGHALHITSKASHAHSTQPLKKLKISYSRT